MITLSCVFFTYQLLDILCQIEIVGPLGDGLCPGIGPQGQNIGKLLLRHGGKHQRMSLGLTVGLQAQKRGLLVALHGHGIDIRAGFGHHRAEKQTAVGFGKLGTEIIPPQKGAADGAVTNAAGMLFEIAPQQVDVLQSQRLEFQHKNVHFL